jgi:hypothetical protein
MGNVLRSVALRACDAAPHPLPLPLRLLLLLLLLLLSLPLFDACVLRARSPRAMFGAVARPTSSACAAGGWMRARRAVSVSSTERVRKQQQWQTSSRSIYNSSSGRGSNCSCSEQQRRRRRRSTGQLQSVCILINPHR